MLVRFANFEMGFGYTSNRMQGFTGTTYGTPAKFDHSLTAQVVDVEIKSDAEFLKIIKELKDAYHIPLRKWVPILKMEEAKAEPFERPMTAFDANPEYFPNAGIQKSPLANMHHKTLRALAKAENVDVTACKSVPEMAAAIEAHRKAA